MLYDSHVLCRCVDEFHFYYHATAVRILSIKRMHYDKQKESSADILTLYKILIPLVIQIDNDWWGMPTCKILAHPFQKG